MSRKPDPIVQVPVVLLACYFFYLFLCKPDEFIHGDQVENIGLVLGILIVVGFIIWFVGGFLKALVLTIIYLVKGRAK